MENNKSVDSIKKMSPKKRAESRRIVLEEIKSSNIKDGEQKKEVGTKKTLLLDSIAPPATDFLRPTDKQEARVAAELKRQTNKENEKNTLTKNFSLTDKKKKNINSQKKAAVKISKNKKLPPKTKSLQERFVFFVKSFKKNILKLQKKIIISFKKFLFAIKSNFKKSIFIFTVLSVFACFLYFSFLGAVNLWPNHFYFAQNYFYKIPLPIMFSKNNFLTINDYFDIKQKSSNFSSTAIEKAMINKLITGYLFKKYKTNNKEIISKMLVADTDINQVAANRIAKIKQKITKGGDFMEISQKYGDETGVISLKKGDEDRFYPKFDFLSMRPGETSPVVNNARAYYIFYCQAKTNNEVKLNYTKVDAIDFDEYLQNSGRYFKAWKLISI